MSHKQHQHQSMTPSMDDLAAMSCSTPEPRREWSTWTMSQTRTSSMGSQPSEVLIMIRSPIPWQQSQLYSNYTSNNSATRSTFQQKLVLEPADDTSTDDFVAGKGGRSVKDRFLSNHMVLHNSLIVRNLIHFVPTSSTHTDSRHRCRSSYSHL